MTRTTAAYPIVVTDETFADTVLASPLPVIVDFWAPRCAPCRTVEPILNELATEYAGRLMIAKLNADEYQRYVTRLGIRGLPTLIAFREGREMERLLGSHSKPRYQDFIERLLSRVATL